MAAAALPIAARPAAADMHLDAVADEYTTPAGVALDVSAPGVLANDVVPAGADLAVVDQPDHGALTLNADGSFLYTPAKDFTGVDTFTYRLSETVEEGALLADVHAGSGSSRGTSDAQPIVALGAQVFFAAFDSVHGLELRRTDGTTAGTQLVKDIDPGLAPAFSIEHEMVEFNGRLWFPADVGATGFMLWSTDGTEAGTTAFGTAAGESPSQFTVSANRLWFVSTIDDQPRLRSIALDGTLSTHDTVTNPGDLFAFGEVVAFGDGVAFAGATVGTGVELWHATATGVTLLADVFPGSVFGEGNSSHPTDLVVANDTLYFAADDGGGHDFYRWDPVAGAAVQVVTGSPVAVAPSPLGVLYEDGGHLQLIDASHTLLTLTPPSVTSSTMGTWIGDAILFPATDDLHGTELWSSDGTVQGATLFMDIATGSVSGFPADLTRAGDRVYFTALEPSSRAWATDGTTAGTAVVAAADPLAVGDRGIFGGPPGKVVFFAQGSSTEGNEPWIHRAATTFDDAVVTITVGTSAPASVGIAEAVGVTDRVLVRTAATISISESIAVADRIGAQPPVIIAVTESITASDDAGVRPAILLSVAEAVAVQDLVEARGAAMVVLSEVVTVEDLVDAAVAGPADSDGDGIPDELDVEPMEDAIRELPDDAFASPGARDALLAIVGDIEAAILAEDWKQALNKLESLERRTDGCGDRPDRNDWIVDCAAQSELRALINELMRRVEGVMQE